jgi:hypothetical protein
MHKIFTRTISSSSPTLKGRHSSLKHLIPYMKNKRPKINSLFDSNVEKVKSMEPWVHEKYRRSAGIKRKEMKEKKQIIDEYKEIEPQIKEINKSINFGTLDTLAMENPDPLQRYYDLVKSYRQKYKEEMVTKEMERKLRNDDLNTKPIEKINVSNDDHLIKYAYNILFSHQQAAVKAEKVKIEKERRAEKYKSWVKELEGESEEFVTFENLDSQIDKFLNSTVKISMGRRELVKKLRADEKISRVKILETKILEREASKTNE